MSFDALRRDNAVRDRMIDALDVVRSEPVGQNALRIQREREHHQAARVLVEPVNHAERGGETASAHSPQQGSRAVDQCVLVARLVDDAQHSGGLVDDDEVAVEEHDRALGQGAGAELRRAFVDDHHRAGRNAQGRVEAALPIHRHAPFRAQVTRARPRGARLLAHDRGDGRRPRLAGRGSGFSCSHHDSVGSSPASASTRSWARAASRRRPKSAGSRSD